MVLLADLMHTKLIVLDVLQNHTYVHMVIYLIFALICFKKKYEAFPIIACYGFYYLGSFLILPTHTDGATQEFFLNITLTKLTFFSLAFISLIGTVLWLKDPSQKVLELKQARLTFLFGTLGVMQILMIPCYFFLIAWLTILSKSLSHWPPNPWWSTPSIVLHTFMGVLMHIYLMVFCFRKRRVAFLIILMISTLYLINIVHPLIIFTSKIGLNSFILALSNSYHGIFILMTLLFVLFLFSTNLILSAIGLILQIKYDASSKFRFTLK